MVALSVITALYLAAWLWRERMYDKQTREERHAFRLERTGLLNRIQVPEAAPYMDTEEDPAPQHVPFDDDKAFAAAAEDQGFEG